MKLQLISKKESEIHFILQDSNPVVTNTLRRLMVSEVPVMAIEEVTFVKNDSALYDEFIAHRLGLLPLTTDIESYTEKSKCTCKGEGCAKCQVMLSLKAKGPTTVYSESIQSQDPKIHPVFKEMPIVQLLKGQELELEATASLGRGKTHAKYTPGLVVYKEVPTIKIKNTKAVESALKPIQNQVDIEKDEVKIKDLVNTNVELIEQYAKEDIEVTHSKKEFIFTIESFGQLTSKEIAEKSIDIFNEKLEEFEKVLKDSKASKLTTLTKKIKG